MTGPKPDIRSDHPTSDLLSGRTLFRVGLALVIGAFVYFLRYSIEQGWIGPLGQLGLAAAAGIAMVVVGDQISRHRPIYGNLLQGGGAAALYLTGFAAHHRSDLLEAGPTTALLAVISAGVLGLALRHHSQPLSLVGLAGAMAAPLLLGSGYDPVIGLTVIAVGAALYLARGWYLTFILAGTSIAAMLTLAIVFPRAGLDAGRTGVTVGLAGLLVGFWAVSIYAAARRPDSMLTAAVIPVSTTIAIPLLTYAATVFVWRDALDRPGRLALACGVVTAVILARVAFARTSVPALTRDALWIAAGAVSVVGLFGGFDLSVALLLTTFEAAAFVILGLRFAKPSLLAMGGAVMGVLMVTWPIRTAIAADGVFDMADVSTLSFVLALAAVGRLVPANGLEPGPTIRLSASGIAVALAMLWPLASLQPIETGLVTAVWVVIGLSLVVTGKLASDQVRRNIGLAITALAVGKLLVVDTAEVAPLGRVGLFAGIGLSLLVVGFWLGDDRNGDHPEPPIPAI